MKVIVHVEGDSTRGKVESTDVGRIVAALLAMGLLTNVTRFGIELVDELEPETKP